MAEEKKVLYFEGAGMYNTDAGEDVINNCRIRTAFHLDDGRAVYLEAAGSRGGKGCNPAVYRWSYTGFVDFCHYITDDKPNDDSNVHRVRLSNRRRIFEYSKKALLKLVNSLGASFDAVEVVPELGGYRVFPEKLSCCGLNGYYYGDEFHLNPAMVARREEVRKYVYDLEARELKEDRKNHGRKFVHSFCWTDHPNFSLWVDEKDPGLLHLLRHFNGYNKHWSIRTDTGDALENWLATMQETELGRYGC